LVGGKAKGGGGWGVCCCWVVWGGGGAVVELGKAQDDFLKSAKKTKKLGVRRRVKKVQLSVGCFWRQAETALSTPRGLEKRKVNLPKKGRVWKTEHRWHVVVSKIFT